MTPLTTVDNFENFGLSAPVMAAMADMGFTTPTPIQRQALPILLAGANDFIGLASTGTGKTAAFGIPLMAYAGSIEDDKGQFALVQRFLFMPMFLFSGTFYPLETLPVWLQWIGWVSPLWHGAELGRVATYGTDVAPVMMGVHIAYLVVLSLVGYLWGRRVFIERLAK